MSSATPDGSCTLKARGRFAEQVSWVGWTVFVMSQVPIGAFVLLLFLCFDSYRGSRGRLRRALYASRTTAGDLISEQERFQERWNHFKPELYNVMGAGGDITDERERIRSEWGNLQSEWSSLRSELYNNERAINDLVHQWDNHKNGRKLLTAAILATAVFGIADGLVLCGVVGPGWPVPANVSTEFLLLGTGAFIGLFLKAYDFSVSPTVYMWPPALGLVVCLVILKVWPTGAPLRGAISPVPRGPIPGGAVHAGGSATSVGLGAWQVAATMIGATGTFMVGCAAVFRRRAGK